MDTSTDTERSQRLQLILTVYLEEKTGAEALNPLDNSDGR